MKATKLPSGSYRVRVTTDGKTYSFTDKDKKTALKMAKAFKEETTERIENPTFKDAMDKYIKENEAVLSASTLRNYEAMKRMLLLHFPEFCSRNVIAIKNNDVQRILNGLSLSPKSFKNYLGFIQPVCDRKFKVKIPQKEYKEMRVPTDMEVKGLLKLFEDTELYVPILLAAYGPLRRGEICALTLDDFDGDYVSVTKDIVRTSENNWVIKPPKTYSSNRKVLLPHFVVEAVHKKGYITKYNADRISSEFRKKQIRIGVTPPYNFHSLRHYCVSSLHANNIPDEYIMQRGGWSTPTVLHSVYRHTLSDKTDEISRHVIEHFESCQDS